MKRFLNLLLAAALLAPIAARAAEAPDKLIQRVSGEMIDRIRADAGLQSGDYVKMSALVDATVMPHVDFQRMTALAVGRHWRTATPEQQRLLMAEFRTLLLRTYSGALSAVKDQSVRMKPMRADPKDTDVVVRSEVVPPRGEPIQLDYRLRRQGEAWKIYDVNVLGVWLIETYRHQFGQEVNAGGLDGLIRALTEKNRSFVEQRRS